MGDITRTERCVDVEELFSRTVCGVCSKRYKDPRILPCLHSFCLQCLHHEVEKSDSQQVVKCPTCDKQETTPEGGVNILPQNLHLAFEVEVAGFVSKIVNNNEVACDECTDGINCPAVVFCAMCHQFLCRLCHEHHKRSRKLSQHVMVRLDNEGARQLLTIMKPKDRYCQQPNHEDNKASFYCETCSQMVCLYCTTVAHKNHNVSELSTVAKTHQMEIKEALDKTKEVVTKLTEAIDGKNKMIEEAEISNRNALLVIEQAFEILQQTLNERKKELLSELKAITLSKITHLTKEKEDLEKIVEDIGCYTKVASHILETHTEHEVVALGRLIPTALQGTLKPCTQTTSLTENQLDSVCTLMQTDKLVGEISKFGKVLSFSPLSSNWKAKVGSKYRMTVEFMNSKGEKYRCDGVAVKGEMRSKTHNEAVVCGEVEDHRNGKYTITFIPETSGPHEVLITMDGHRARNCPLDIDVRPKRDYHSLCDAQQMINCGSEPRGIAIHDNGDIYVGANNHCIYVFDERGQLKNTIGTEGSGDGQFRFPNGIFIKGDVLYVADTGNHRIQKLKSTGVFVDKFGKKGSDQSQFDTPMSVVMDSSNRLIVADRNNNRIQIFTENGGWLLTIDGSGSGDNSFQHPLGLALDPEENIHVIPLYSKGIKVFDKKGSYIRIYGDLKGPKEIAINEEGYSFVSELDGNCISIYDNKGDKIKTLGSLNRPCGIGLHRRCDSLFVANFGAGNVLKYCL